MIWESPAFTVCWRIQEKIALASVLIVVAGMEGALPSVVGGLVDRPVIAVPTSVGYGASFGGSGPAGHAQLLRLRGGRSQHRQWLRRRLPGHPDQSAFSGCGISPPC